jgi:hypothetical protein
MAAFSTAYPVAVHVLPLHALKGVLDSGALLAKAGLQQNRQRVTTRSVDQALGFGDMVHFYLPRHPADWGALPILAAQLRPSLIAPFPHVALSLTTSELTDEECTLCMWNIAISRPKVEGVCQGGNWARGTSAASIEAVWRHFARTKPPVETARGHWNPGFLVPTVKESQIGPSLRLLRRAPRQSPELLLRGPVALTRLRRLHVFSEEDAECVRVLTGGPEVELNSVSGYDSTCSETNAWRRQIKAYFSGGAPYPRDLDPDRIRPSRVDSPIPLNDDEEPGG